MTAGTVISGGFPGRVAQEVQPNQKCSGCLHYDGQGGRTGVCTIGLKPWTCGDGQAPQVSYAPIARGAGSYLPDMCNHGAHAPEVAPQEVGGLYGVGSTRPVEIRQVSLGEEHVHLVKGMVERHAQLQKSQCRMCSMRGTHGTAPPNVEAQVCTCAPLQAQVVAKAVVSMMSNAQRVGLRLGDVVEWVRDVAKAGFRLPARTGSDALVKSNEVSLADRVRIDGNGGHLRPINKSKTATEVRSPTSTKTKTATATEVRSPTSTSTDAYTQGNVTVTGGAGSGDTHVHLHGGQEKQSRRADEKAHVERSRGSAKRPEKMMHETGAPRPDNESDETEEPKRKNKVTSKSDNMSKGFYGDDWIAQFRGTPLFDEARKLCEQELSMQEEQLKRREARTKHEQERRAALDKISQSKNSAVPDDDWQKQDIKREKMMIAKQRLVLKLVASQQKSMSKGRPVDPNSPSPKLLHPDYVDGVSTKKPKESKPKKPARPDWVYGKQGK